MNLRIPLYQLARSGASIYVARLETADIGPGEPGQERVALALAVEVTLWGERGEPRRRAEFSRPQSQTARLKYPDPIWGRVDLEPGARILLVTAALDERPADPLYVDPLQGPSDAVLEAVRSVLGQEREEAEARTRCDRYVTWLMGAEPVAKLYAAEALAREPQLADGDPEGFVARAFAAALDDEHDFVRVNVASLMIEQFYAHVGQQARAILLNAVIRLAEGEEPVMEEFALDRLSTLSPADLQGKGVRRSDKAAQRLQNRLAIEPSAEARDQLLKRIKILRREL